MAKPIISREETIALRQAQDKEKLLEHLKKMPIIGVASGLIVVMAFRDSGKSKIMNMSYALWAVLGKHKKKFVLIVSKTASQAQIHFSNILRELENNSLLASDLGPFDADHTTKSLTLKTLGAKIMAVSREQGIRGSRPDLILCDDLEDSISVADKVERDATYEWLKKEVLPLGSEGTNVVVLGNLLHADSLLMRLKKDIAEKKIEGEFRAYPIVDDNKKPLWPSRFKNNAAVQAFRCTRTIEGDKTWDEEYLLCTSKGNKMRWYDPDRDKRERALHRKKFPPRRLGHYRISAPILQAIEIMWKNQKRANYHGSFSYWKRKAKEAESGVLPVAGD